MDRLASTNDYAFGMEDSFELDHSNNGCTMIAFMIAALALLGLLSSTAVERVIDSYCQTPLKDIRDALYADKGFALISSEDALEDLIERQLFPSMNVSSS